MKASPPHPELALTAVERRPWPREPRVKFDPVRLFVDRNLAARFWFVLFLAALTALVMERVVSPPSRGGEVIVLDAAGSIHDGRLMSFREAKALHLQQATLATQAFLNRTPLDFDNPDLLSSLFSAEALAKAKAHLAQDASERAAKQLHQKVEIDKIDLLQTRDDLLLVDVRGQLIRNGSFLGQPFSEGVRFRLRLRMTRNPNLGLNARFPTLVTDFKHETSN